MVGKEELESSTFAVSERHSNQLNYLPVFWCAYGESNAALFHGKEILYRLTTGAKLQWRSERDLNSRRHCCLG